MSAKPRLFSDQKRLIVTVAFLAILFLGFWLRHYSLWLPHWKGDQSQYLSLAAKLNAQGLEGYNLRNISIRAAKSKNDPGVLFAYPVFNPNDNEGDLLRILKATGSSYFDEPLHMRAPLFPYALLFSHHLFGQKGKSFVVCQSNLGEDVLKKRPSIILKTQFWAAIVPIFFDVLLIVLTFLLGAYLFGHRIGIYAMFLMAVNPVGLFVSSKLLSESMVVCFATASMLLFICMLRIPSLIGVFIAGAVGGVAFLTNQKSVLLIAVVFLSVVIGERKIKNAAPLIYLLGFTMAASFWLWKTAGVYGDPFHLPSTMDASIDADTSGWFESLKTRPHPVLLFSLSILGLSPPFVFAYASLLRFGQSANIRILWIWILVFLVYYLSPLTPFKLNLAREHRYFYFAYPAIAVLSAYMIDRTRIALGKDLGNVKLAEAGIVACLIASALWMIGRGWGVIIEAKMLL